MAIQDGQDLFYNPVMSSATTAPDPISFEQWLFQKSPVGTAATAASLFVIAVGSYVAIALTTGASLFDSDAHMFHIAPYAWSALVLSLLTATVLAMQRYTHTREQTDEAAFLAISGGSASTASILAPASRRNMLWANVLGVALGIVLAWLTVPSIFLQHHLALFAWNVAITMFLGALFVRGVVMTTQGERAFSRLIEHDLHIDLLHVDKLAVIGRNSARNALIWFTVAAIVCLFFVGDGLSSTIIVILTACAGMGLWIFLRPMEQVHRRIRAEKAIELDRVRNEIGNARHDAVHDAPAATRLQGLLAYEARIQSVHEWPFDQSTLMRVVAYVLIPAIPWFGEAFVSDMIQKFAH
ncbi:MAG: hypothetical protein ABSC92_10805 [Rhizomicrobium sp.]